MNREGFSKVRAGGEKIRAEHEREEKDEGEAAKLLAKMQMNPH